MTSLADLVVEQPADTAGVPAGGDWRLVVQAALPATDGAVPGHPLYDDTDASDRATVWRDLTQYVHGIDVTRGTFEFGSDPLVGIATIELESDRHQFAPWNNGPTSWGGFGTLFDSGLLMRVAVVDPVADEWQPVFTGEVQQWREETTVEGRNVRAVIDLAETSLHMANEKITTGTPGTAPWYNPGGRFTGSAAFSVGAYIAEAVDDTLTDQSSFPYGVVSSVPASPDSASRRLLEAPDEWYASTVTGTLPISVLEMCQIIAAAGAAVFRTDRYGRAFLAWRYPGYWPDLGGSYTDPYAPASLTVSTDDPGTIVMSPMVDDLAIVNSVYVSNRAYVQDPSTDATEYVYEDATSIAKYGRRYLALPDNPAGSFDIESCAEQIVDHRANLTDRVEHVTLDDRQLDKIVVADIDSPITVDYRPPESLGYARFTGYVRGIVHRIGPLNGSEVVWTTDLTLDTYTVAELDPPLLLTNAAAAYLTSAPSTTSLGEILAGPST